MWLPERQRKANTVFWVVQQRHQNFGATYHFSLSDYILYLRSGIPRTNGVVFSFFIFYLSSFVSYIFDYRYALNINLVPRQQRRICLKPSGLQWDKCSFNSSGLENINSDTIQSKVYASSVKFPHQHGKRGLLIWFLWLVAYSIFFYSVYSFNYLKHCHYAVTK